MIAPIKRTQAARGSSSQVSAEPLRVWEACGGADAWCVAGDGEVVDREVEVVGEVEVEVVGAVEAVGAVAVVVVGAPVGLSGNC